MKERLSAFYNNPRKGKKRRTSAILTIVALIEIFAILVVSTSAWVESISSIMIHTTYDATDNTSGTKGIVESILTQTATVSKNSTAEIDLRNFFRQSGGYHLCGASSVDGNTMYFPEIYGGNTSNYRIGSINDKNVNYISFTIKTSAALDFAFAQVPTISFGGTALSGDNRKLVRFSVGDNSGNYKVFSLYPSTFTENVPAADDGATSPTTVYPFADYVAGKERVVTTTAKGFLSFNMWIQDPTGAKRSVYQNKALTVDNLKLVAVVPFKLISVYTDDDGVFKAGGIGGTVAIGADSEYSSEVTKYVTQNPSTTLSLYAKASASNGYQFLGFRTNGTTPIGSSTTSTQASTSPYNHTVTTTASTLTVWALFSNTHNIYMKPEFSHPDTSLYKAFVFGVDSTGATSGKWYDMSNVTSGTWSGYKKCVYRGSATNIIFCYMDPDSPSAATLNTYTSATAWGYRWLQTYDLVAPSQMGEFGYIVTCRQVLDGVTANGVTYDNPRNAAIDDIEGSSHNYGTNKLLGYWTHNYVKVQLAYTTNSVNGSNGSYGKIYPSLIDTCKQSGHAYWYADDDTNRRVYLDGKSYQDLDPNGDIIPQYKYDKAVMLTAEDNNSYLFEGWYSNAAGTTALPDVTVDGVTYTYTDKSYPITAPDNGTYSGTDLVTTANYYAKFKANPLTYQLKWGSSSDGDWDTINMTETSSGSNIYTCTKTLNAGENMYFKFYNIKTDAWFGNGGDYVDIIKSTIVSNASLSSPGTNMHIKSGFVSGATYTFTLDATGTTKKMTITASGTQPAVRIWHGNSDTASGGYWTMTKPGTSSNVYTYTTTSSTDFTEGQEIYFKINDNTRSEWWTNATHYNGFTIKTLLSNGQLSSSGGNMRISAHAGRYKFSFDYSTKKLSIEVTSWSNITITLNSTNVSSWIGDGSAKIYYVSENDENGLHWEQMTASNSNKTYTVSVPSNYANNTQFLRRDSGNTTTWNYWPSSTVYRGFKKKFTISSSDGNNHTGSWS